MNPNIILRYPSPNLKITKSNSSEPPLSLRSSALKLPFKEIGNIDLQSQTSQKPNQSQSASKDQRPASCNADKTKISSLFEKLRNENNILRRKLETFDDKISNPSLIQKASQVIDFRAFFRTNMDRFNDLLADLYQNRRTLEKEQAKNKELEKRIEGLKGSESNKSEAQKRRVGALVERKEKLERQLLNFQEEVNSLKERQNGYREKMNKRDFFSEYDAICKEVDELRRTNFNLTETLKKYIPVQEKESHGSS